MKPRLKMGEIVADEVIVSVKSGLCGNHGVYD